MLSCKKTLVSTKKYRKQQEKAETFERKQSTIVQNLWRQISPQLICPLFACLLTKIPPFRGDCDEFAHLYNCTFAHFVSFFIFKKIIKDENFQLKNRQMTTIKLSSFVTKILKIDFSIFRFFLFLEFFLLLKSSSFVIIFLLKIFFLKDFI